MLQYQSDVNDPVWETLHEVYCKNLLANESIVDVGFKEELKSIQNKDSYLFIGAGFNNNGKAKFMQIVKSEALACGVSFACDKAVFDLLRYRIPVDYFFFKSPHRLSVVTEDMNSAFIDYARIVNKDIKFIYEETADIWCETLPWMQFYSVNNTAYREWLFRIYGEKLDDNTEPDHLPRCTTVNTMIEVVMGSTTNKTGRIIASPYMIPITHAIPWSDGREIQQVVVDGKQYMCDMSYMLGYTVLKLSLMVEYNLEWLDY
jgi:hypothetical protein